MEPKSISYRIICVLTVISSSQASEYYKSDKYSTWKEAKSICDLALPGFKNELGQNLVNITTGVTADLWVGYFKASAGFEYKGCIRNENFKPIMNSATLTIGQCYSACGRKQIIGINGKKCYCEDQFNYTEGYHSEYCYNAKSCKVKDCNTCDENSCLSIYSINQNVTKDQTVNIVNDMCLMFSGTENSYAWKDCNQLLRVFCKVESGERHSSRGDETWKESAHWCFNYNRHPLTFAKLQAINESSEKPVWTDIISSSVIYTYKEYDNSLSNIMFGYVESKDSHTGVLKFKEDMATNKALCRNDFSTSAPQTKTETDRQEVSSDHHFITSNGEQTADNQDFSTSTTQTEPETARQEVSTDPRFINSNDEQTADNQDSDVGLIVGASVGTILLVGVVVGCIMIFKRRHKGTNKHTQSRDTTKGGIEQPNDRPYATNHLGTDEPTKDDTLYDTPCSTKKYKEVDTGNIYNKLDTDVNATYDHANNKRKIGAYKEEDTYDTAEMETMVTKADSKANSFGDTGEDTYHHINRTQVKACKTDNVYGVSSDLGNGEKSTSSGRDLHCEGDTYSLINKASHTCSKTDNIYGVPNKLDT